MHLSRFARNSGLVALGGALLSGCAVPPQLGKAPAIATPDHYAATHSLAGSGTVAWPARDWWKAYGDAQLDALIAEALAGSPDMAAATAQLRQSEAMAQEMQAARLPRLDATGNVATARQSYNNGIPADFVPKGWNSTGQIAGNLGFDLDLWGRNRAAYAAARSEMEAAELEYQQSALLLSTGIAAAYADLAQLFAQREIQATALELRRQTQKLVSDRVVSGLDTQAELKQASAAVPAARADLAATDEQIAITRNRIAALLGKGPDRGLEIMAPKVAVQARDIPRDVTTDLIGRRPDIAAARARVEAEASRIKVARADFFPAINLSAIVGFQSLGLDNLLKSGSRFGQAGPAISLPLFQGGALQGRYRGARARYDLAVADYDRSVADAYRAVADAVASRNALGVRLTESEQALADSESAYAIARMRYEGGLSTFLDVLTAQDRALQAQRIVSDLRSRAFTLDVALVRALGGGFGATTEQVSKDGNNG